MEFIPALQTAYCVFIINNRQLILYRVIISVYCENHTRSKHKTQDLFYVTACAYGNHTFQS